MQPKHSSFNFFLFFLLSLWKKITSLPVYPIKCYDSFSVANLKCLQVRKKQSNTKPFSLTFIEYFFELLNVIWGKVWFVPTVQVASTELKPMQ